MTRSSAARFVLIGGGLGGALLATHLGQAGYAVELFERRPDPAAGTLVGGRSINLALSVRGLHALAQVGLDQEVLKTAMPMRGRMIHSRDGRLTFQPYDQDPSRCIYSVGRGALNAITLAAAQKLPNVRVIFDHRCVDVDLERPSAELISAQSNQSVQASGDVLIGVDGAFSAVRRAMQRLDRFDFQQQYLAHGYKELSIPPSQGGGFQLQAGALHIWPRRSFMMIALPNHDGSHTCTLFYPFSGFDALRSDADVLRFFESEFPDALPLMPNLLSDFREHPTGSMVTMRCRPWQAYGKVALLGDAAHAVVPFYGQGANAAFEDCTVLSECLRAHTGDLPLALRSYEARRKPHADALADLALANFIEMRDHTGSRVFLWHKKLERTLHRTLPGFFTPLYTLVSFTRTPYADAVRRAALQNSVVAASLALLVLLLALAGLHWLIGWDWSRSALLTVLGGVIAWQAVHLLRQRSEQLARRL